VQIFIIYRVVCYTFKILFLCLGGNWLGLSYLILQLEDIRGHMKDSAESIQKEDEVNKFTKDFSVEDDPISLQRRDKIKDAMLHAWTSYETYAWGRDELKVFHNIFLTFLLIHYLIWWVLYSCCLFFFYLPLLM